ncbi:MAG TPA: DUF4127 family protein [Beutenbergiaceae bacterium]|nr:DUF4127 family protein [Beutenbergiaceae bacterium]
MRIAYLPLDERPVNTDLVRDIATLSGGQLLLPPEELLPNQREAGDADALGEWLRTIIGQEQVDTVVVSVDMLAFGGLIPSRTSADDVREALGRLEVLTSVKQSLPQVPIHGVSLVMRASDSYSAGEEPEYWSSYGRDLHAYGGARHRDFLNRAALVDDQATTAAGQAIPTDVLLDFTHRRLRNHLVNLTAIDMAARGIFDTLVITSDDTATRSAGSLEQIWLQNWSRVLPGAGDVAFYPGADEVGAVLLARAMTESAGDPVRLAPVCPEPEGWSRVAEFENMPLDQATIRQIHAAGGVSAEAADAEVVLVVHAPAPAGFGRGSGQMGADGQDPVHRTVAAVAEHLGAGRRVALADVRYSNGSDTGLLHHLEQAGLVGQLWAYGGWNTAGNTTGGVVATAVAGVLASRAGQVDQSAVQRLLLHRILEDHEYQGVLREQIRARLHGQGVLDDLGDRFPSGQVEAAVAEEIRGRLQAAADRLSGPGRWTLRDVHLPWHRLFEVGFTLVPGPGKDGGPDRAASP